ncbi:hypothetical protein ACP70R_031338 [Stipagrostis hirtigluma subsp. patula]
MELSPPYKNSFALDGDSAELSFQRQHLLLRSNKHKVRVEPRVTPLTMSKKIVIKADLVGKKCMSEILSVVAKLQGIKSMDVDPEKCTLTVVGAVDPVRIVQKLKKACLAATIVSVADDKPPEEKKKDPCNEACEKLCKARCDKLACCKECKEKCEKSCKERCEKSCKAWLDKGCSCGGAGGSCCTPTPATAPAPGCYFTTPYYGTPGCYGYYGKPVGYGAYCYEEPSPGAQCTIQ